MIPILYESAEKSFTSNGLGRLADCTRCVVTEERNGVYECEFDYPISGEMYDQITEGRIIACTHDDVHDIQPFDIYARSAPLNGLVTFYAHHISYRLGNIILEPFTATSCAQALAGMATNTYNTNPFTFWTDKTTTGNWRKDVPTAVRAALGGQQGSILDTYGKGEYEFDKWAVKLHASRGVDNGVSIRYGVNLTEMLRTYDVSGSYTAVAPYWKSSEDDTVVMLPEGMIVSGNAPIVTEQWETGDGQLMYTGDGQPLYFQFPKVVPIALDLSDEFDEPPTVAQLRAEATRQLNNSEAWIPDDNIKISFVDLSHTEEYASVAALQRVRLCDKVSVYCGPLGVSAVKVQVIKTAYNVLLEMYDSIELGKPKASFAETIMRAVDETVATATADLTTMSQLQAAVDNATDLITGATDSHVKLVLDANGRLQEILVMDTDDINTAVKVWRWNSGGLGFSSNGYGGPYSLAMTQDGAIVADMITTGTLAAGLIKAGVLQDVAGLNYWNMATGAFSLSSSTTVGGSTVSSIAESAASSAVSGQTQLDIFNKLTNNGQTQGVYLKNGLLYINATYMDTGTLSADVIGAGTITSAKLDSGVTSAISTAQSTADGAASAASSAQTTANGANKSEQLVYYSAASGTSSVTAPSTWVTNTTGNQNTWTTHRPVYNSSYPVLFVATQRQDMAGTITCTTPAIDQTTTVIDGGHITTGTIDASVVTVNKINASNITTGTLSADRIGAGTITSGKLDSAVTTAITTAQTTANSANDQEQLVYKSAASGTSSMAAPTTWITQTSAIQAGWTIRRPKYDSSYPVLFVATQRKSVGGTVTCTTPQIDETTTVIDGGHITTGSIDAARVTTGTMSAARIKGGTLTLGGAGNVNGSLSITNASGTVIGKWDKDGITINGGTITSADGNNSWDLSDGTFTSTSGGLKVVVSNGQIEFFRNNVSVGHIDAANGLFNIDGEQLTFGDVSGNGSRISTDGENILLYGDIVLEDVLGYNTGLDTTVTTEDASLTFAHGILVDASSGSHSVVSGSFAISNLAYNNFFTQSITFGTAQPDTNYTIYVEFDVCGLVSSVRHDSSFTTSGCTIVVGNMRNQTLSGTARWILIRK